jgi:hypothetical protein
MTIGYMLDTNVFDHLLDGRIDVTRLLSFT